MAEFEPGIRASRGERFASAFIAAWIRLCRRTMRWTRQGEESVLEARRNGPVLLVFWHSRVVMGSALVPRGALPLVSLFATNRDGRIAAGVQRRFGFRPIGMGGKGGESRAVRAVLSAVRDGHSLAIPGDNSRLGARNLAPAPLDWAKATGVPVFVHANSARRHLRLPGWDKMLLPLPFSRGASVYRRWDGELPRDASADEIAAARESLSAALDRVTADADALVGLPPGP